MTEPTTTDERAEWASYYEFYNRGSKREGSRVRRLIDQVETLTDERDDLVESYVEALVQVEKHMALHDRECCKLVVSSVAPVLKEKP